MVCFTHVSWASGNRLVATLLVNNAKSVLHQKVQLYVGLKYFYDCSIYINCDMESSGEIFEVISFYWDESLAMIHQCRPRA